MIGLDLMGETRPPSTRWEIVGAVAAVASAVLAAGTLAIRWKKWRTR